MSDKEIIFAIHDFNQRGGQDRSTLEIVQHLGKQKKIELHAFTFEADRPHANISFRPVLPRIGKPALLKILLYHFITLARFFGKRQKRPPICATGACSLVSDIIHVQFVHASWRRRKEKNSLYGKVVALYNIFTERLTFSPRKTYIAISHAVKADLEREYGLNDITVVHHGVNSEKFRPCRDLIEKSALRKSLGLGADLETVLLFVGTYERKGLGAILKALSLLPKDTSSSLRLVAVGSGDQKFYSTLAREFGIEHQVSLFSPKANIEEYFRAADIFVFPTTYEPFGLVILEAMASGLPCIVSRIAGGAELIKNAESGLLLENPLDAIELSRRIEELALDDEAQVSMGKKARLVAEERNWAQVAREYEAVVARWREG
jgi:glycosyltransferase involved in cell wall biosynthesis